MKKPEEYTDREIMERIAMNTRKTADCVETIRTILVVYAILTVVGALIIAFKA